MLEEKMFSAKKRNRRLTKRPKNKTNNGRELCRRGRKRTEVMTNNSRAGAAYKTIAGKEAGKTVDDRRPGGGREVRTDKEIFRGWKGEEGK